MWQEPTQPPACQKDSFSALTLGFFDVARRAKTDITAFIAFQCPNAGLLRCGGGFSWLLLELRRFSALTLGFFDVARCLWC